MLTVLHKTDDADVYYEAIEVSRTSPFSSMAQGLHVTRPYGEKGDCALTLLTGVAYVMNANGATVGKYVLSDKKAQGSQAAAA